MLHCEPSTVPLALADPHWKDAMETEYQALLKNNTWELVPPSEMPIILFKVNGCFEQNSRPMVPWINTKPDWWQRVFNKLLA